MVSADVIKELIEEMSDCGLFVGKYDAKNGNAHFMNGVCTVMEYLAYRVSCEYGDKFSDAFAQNMVDSENKAMI